MSLLLSLTDKCEMSCSSLRGGAEAISCDDGEEEKLAWPDNIMFIL